MPSVRQDINPALLAWAMKQSDIDENELANRANINVAEVQSWLAGHDKPGLTALRSVAKVLKRSTSFFFLPNPPASSTTVASFRAPIGSSGPRKISPDELNEIRTAARRQKIASWVLKEINPEERVSFPISNGDPEKAAIEARSWLQWNTVYQVRASTKAGANKRLRSALEERGILVLQIQMGRSQCRGFSIADAQVPLIAVNSTGHIASARTFTMLHELAHLTLGEQAVCDLPDDSHERWCDRFASAFMMPRQHLREYLGRNLKKGYIESDDLDSVRLISNRYKASYQCVALRLIELGAADWSLYQYIRSGSYEHDKPFPNPNGGQTTPEVRLREYGTTYPRLVIAAIDDNKISELDGRRFLNVNGEQLANLRSRLTDVA
ncbi:ImmA/IrrE family metallo-endopeptidase [Planotetraspora mira]|uniref:DNA-binding protein n=1 Tax=Planotetraspora mira TaxID=58121 RepID=A0A8J3X719_9ACTN|nr:XRE family transcriptional regulator [Planotetraspora mira]GII29841.1 DNA-binding protein [Planotetraspora mira]